MTGCHIKRQHSLLQKERRPLFVVHFWDFFSPAGLDPGTLKCEIPLFVMAYGTWSDLNRGMQNGRFFSRFFCVFFSFFRGGICFFRNFVLMKLTTKYYHEGKWVKTLYEREMKHDRDRLSVIWTLTVREGRGASIMPHTLPYVHPQSNLYRVRDPRRSSGSSPGLGSSHPYPSAHERRKYHQTLNMKPCNYATVLRVRYPFPCLFTKHFQNLLTRKDGIPWIWRANTRSFAHLSWKKKGVNDDGEISMNNPRNGE